MPPNHPRPIRFHGSFISDSETRRVVNDVKTSGSSEFDDRLIQAIMAVPDYATDFEDERDERYEAALKLVLRTGRASASYLQRRLKMGYPRAARLIDSMERDGILGLSEGSKPREILIDRKRRLREMEKKKGKRGRKS